MIRMSRNYFLYRNPILGGTRHIGLSTRINYKNNSADTASRYRHPLLVIIIFFYLHNPSFPRRRYYNVTISVYENVRALYELFAKKKKKTTFPVHRISSL